MFYKTAYAIGGFEGFDMTHAAVFGGCVEQVGDAIMCYPTWNNTHVHLINTRDGIQRELIVRECDNAWSVTYIGVSNDFTLEQIFWSYGGHKPILNQIECWMNGERQVLVHTP